MFIQGITLISCKKEKKVDLPKIEGVYSTNCNQVYIGTCCKISRYNHTGIYYTNYIDTTIVINKINDKYYDGKGIELEQVNGSISHLRYYYNTSYNGEIITGEYSLDYNTKKIHANIRIGNTQFESREFIKQ